MPVTVFLYTAHSLHRSVYKAGQRRDPVKIQEFVALYDSHGLFSLHPPPARHWPAVVGLPSALPAAPFWLKCGLCSYPASLQRFSPHFVSPLSAALASAESALRGEENCCGRTPIISNLSHIFTLYKKQDRLAVANRSCSCSHDTLYRSRSCVFLFTVFFVSRCSLSSSRSEKSSILVLRSCSIVM